MAKRSRTRSFEELVASQEFAEPLGSYTPLPMRTFPELIKSMLDLNRDQMIAVLEQEARHAEGMARVFASLVARARRLSQKENLFKHEAEMSSRLAGVQRILRCLQLGTPANDETGEEKPLRELLTERLRTNHEWPPRPNDDE